MKIASAKELSQEHWLKSAQLLIVGTFLADYEQSSALSEENFGGHILAFENTCQNLFQIHFDESEQPEVTQGTMKSSLKRCLPLVKGDFVKEIYQQNDTLFISLTSLPSQKISQEFVRTISIKDFKVASLIFGQK